MGHAFATTVSDMFLPLYASSVRSRFEYAAVVMESKIKKSKGHNQQVQLHRPGDKTVEWAH